MKNCGNEKCLKSNPQPLENFNKNRNRKDGLQHTCKSCRVAFRFLNKDKIALQQSTWQKNNPDKVAKKNTKWNKNNPDKVNAKGRRWRKNNAEKHKAAKNKWEKNNLDKVKAQTARSYIKNREKRLIENARWKKNNPDKVAKITAKWTKNNAGKANAITAKRRAQKLNATPSWLTKEQKLEIQEFYILAKELQWLNNPLDPLQIDHIVPLQGDNVSGLHVPWNLQILPRSKNSSKNNKYDTKGVL